MSELDRRRKYSAEVIVNLRNEIIGACEFASNKACVYATGSFGRHEASEHSDLDLFIAGKSESLIGSDGSDEFGQENLLNHLDEICVQAELIKASRRLGFTRAISLRHSRTLLVLVSRSLLCRAR
jgi:predicted nucleotidyltransferase